MSESKKSYQEIVKATSLFGGVQIFIILIALVRSKIIAVLLGPVGMGIAGLLNSTIGTIDSLLKLGLDTSSVKEISTANAQNDQQKVSIVFASLNRLIWFTGGLAVILTIVFSPLLSQVSFGNSNYTTAFVYVSITLLFKQLATGKIAMLQGLRKRIYLAKSHLLGSFFGLIFTVPLYYIFGVDGIVPAIIISSIIVLIFGWFYAKKLNITLVKISNKEALMEGKAMIKLGITLSMMAFISMLTIYLIQISINRFGGLDEVGLYMAGFAIVNTYVGMVFNAMQTDYFPKLSALSDDNIHMNRFVTEQAIIGILIITPIITVFLTLAPFVIQLLYSRAFLEIMGMVSWGILGTLFKAVSFSMGYVILAKGHSKLFLKTSVFFNSLLFICSIGGYYFGGLTGVGVGFLGYYILHFIVLKIVTGHIYQIHFNREFNSKFVICVLICGMTFLFSFINFMLIKYILMSIMGLISFIFTLYHIDKKIGIKETIQSLRNRKQDESH